MSLLLALLPLFFLIGSLLRGYYPGDVLLTRLRRALVGRPSRCGQMPRPSPSAIRRRPRGGALIAAAMAGRAPPFAA